MKGLPKSIGTLSLAGVSSWGMEYRSDRDHLFNVDPRLPVEESIASVLDQDTPCFHYGGV